MKYLFFLLIILSSCAQKPEVEVDQAIDQAQTLLSSEKCDEAIKILEDVGRDYKNAVYVQVLASAYSCQAGFKMVTFIANDIPAINTTNLMRSLSILTYSPETIVDSTSYQRLKTALGILTHTDKQNARETLYGTRKAGDVGVQILVLSLVQLGKFLHYFGNVDIAGIKGNGAGTNDCFMNYTYATAQNVVTSSGNTGNCTTTNSGHPDMSGAQLRRRLCEGSTTLANILDVIGNLDLSGSSGMSGLENITTVVDDYKADADAAGIGHLMTLTSQAECESLLASSTEMDNMELFYATVFEVGHQ